MLVHGPEVRLCASRLGCHRGGARTWMDLLERKVPEYKAESVRELPLQLMHRVSGYSGIRTLVITVLHQGHCGARCALDVIVTCYGICQSHELLSKSFVRCTTPGTGGCPPAANSARLCLGSMLHVVTVVKTRYQPRSNVSAGEQP